MSEYSYNALGVRVQNVQTRGNANMGYMNALLNNGSRFMKDYMAALSDNRAIWQPTWETEVGTTVQNTTEKVTKNYVVDYLSVANRDIMVESEGQYTQRYVYDESSRRISAEFDYAPGTRRGESGENIASDRAAELGKVWYRTSHLDSTLFAVNASGAVVYHAIYDAWGNPITDTSTDLNFTGLDNRNNYTGYTWDVTLELYFAQNRFYDAENHRFTQEDPVKDGSNWYGYVGNGPLDLVDPWGLYIFADEPGQGPTTKKDAAVKATSSQKSVLTMGQTGDSVYDLQKKLASAGYYSHTELDGSYGPKTEAAVREFQRANGLKVDGNTGPQTWTALLGGNYVQGSDTQGRYSNAQLTNNERKQQDAMESRSKTSKWTPLDYMPMIPAPGQTSFKFHILNRSGNNSVTSPNSIYGGQFACDGVNPEIPIMAAAKQQPESLPKRGEPNSSGQILYPDGTPKQERKYGPDGEAEEDVDYDHGGVGHEFPHRHRWKDGKRGDPEPIPSPKADVGESEPNSRISISPSFMETMAGITGLSGAALIVYIILSEGSRIIPARNLIPVP